MHRKCYSIQIRRGGRVHVVCSYFSQSPFGRRNAHDFSPFHLNNFCFVFAVFCLTAVVLLVILFGRYQQCLALLLFVEGSFSRPLFILPISAIDKYVFLVADKYSNSKLS